MNHLLRFALVGWAILVSHGIVQGQPNITRVEYFIDTDPGIGMATSFGITPGIDLQNLTIPLNPGPLSQGVHRLYVRARNANGHWGLVNTWLFYKPFEAAGVPPVPAPPSNITRIEYYIDTDPGYGQAAPISITPGTQLADLIIPVNPTSLAEGVHRLYIRARNANGNWSLVNSWLFYKPFAAASLPVPSPSNIQRLEYYIDTDPGVGLAIPLAFMPSTNLADIVASINVTGLSAGSHKMYVRAQSLNGHWSLVNEWTFSIAGVLASPAITVTSVSRSTLCARDSIYVGYHATGTINPGNTFKVFLSDAAGSFAAETEIGTVTTVASGIVACLLPSHLPTGAGYKLRVKSSNPVITGVASVATLTIRDRPYAQTITGRNFVNGSYTWPYSVPNVATSTYQWLIGGGIQASGTNTSAITAAWTQPEGNSYAGSLRAVETNQFGCVGDTSLLNPVTIYKLDIGDTVAATVCKGATLMIKTGSTGSFDAGNNLVAELSNASGSFAVPAASVSLAFSANGVNMLNTIHLLVPASLPNGSSYRVRVRSTSPAFIGDSTGSINIQKPDLGTDKTGNYCEGYSFNLQALFTDGSLTYGYFTNAFAVLPNPSGVQAGIYQVIGTNNTGCSDTAMVTVSSNPSPNLGADTTVQHSCPGEVTNLNLLYTTTGLTAVWNTGNPAAAPPGIYRLVVTNNVNCTDTAFATVVLETATWTGTVSNNWHTPGNWSTGKLPSEKTHVIVLSGTPNPCVVSAQDAVAASVQVKTGASVSTTNGRKVLVNGACVGLPGE